jgi:phosphopantothenoylcysteine decarboxylase/phosphopantothenate--cysteine ligase
MHFLITAGGTREYIDPVRFISNASSGKMGYALARAAMKAGHRVTLITAPTTLKPPPDARVIPVETAAEMFQAVKANFERCACLIMAAAVSDYTPFHPSKTKIKRKRGTFALALKPTPDILKWAGRHRSAHHRHRIVVGFALEDKDVRAGAERKMKDKRLDLIVANTPNAISADTSTLHIKSRDSDWIEIPNVSKPRSAAQIIRRVETLAPDDK